MIATSGLQELRARYAVIVRRLSSASLATNVICNHGEQECWKRAMEICRVCGVIQNFGSALTLTRTAAAIRRQSRDSMSLITRH